MLKAKEDVAGLPPKRWFSTHLQILALKALNRRRRQREAVETHTEE